MLPTPVRRRALDYFLGVAGSGRRPVECTIFRDQRVFWALPESVHFAAARTCGRALRGGWESQSSPGDRQGRSWRPRAIPGRASGGHFGTPGGLPGCTFGSSEHDFRSAGRLGRIKFALKLPEVLDRGESSKVVLQVFFSGSAAVAAGHLVCSFLVQPQPQPSQMWVFGVCSP